ncbi:MAG: hypothetical protein HY999_03775 [Nitrospinae bacterium]|nr:hypothetical protein [Nitrospinota bacterium]
MYLSCIECNNPIEVDDTHIDEAFIPLDICHCKRCFQENGGDTLQSSIEDDIPEDYQDYIRWTPSRIIRWAEGVGDATSKIVQRIINTQGYPEQGYRSCVMIFRLGRHYPNERLEAACRRALAIGGYSYKSIRSILEKGLDREPLSHIEPQPYIEHENIRGGDYFN